MKLARRVLSYLYTTRDYRIRYRSGSKFQLKAYTDASHVSKTDMPYSTGGYITYLAEAPITWSSKKITSTVAISSTEIEYIAASEAAMEIEWLHHLFEFIGYPLPPTILYIDNEPAQKLIAHPVNHSRTKHIALRYHKVRHSMKQGYIEVSHISTNEQIADIFTKLLDAEKFRKHLLCMLSPSRIKGDVNV